MGFDDFTRVNIMTRVFWDVTPSTQIGTNVSEKLAASIFRLEVALYQK
jgi:hypothetical protein